MFRFLKFTQPLLKRRRLLLPLGLILSLVIINLTLFREEDMTATSLCEIGTLPWTLDDFRKELQEFRHAYDARPVSHSISGSNLFHAFGQWCIIRMLKPKFIVESGVMLGWGTFMLRKAAGEGTHIIVLSPQKPSNAAIADKQKYYEDSGPSSYLTDDKFQDFKTVDWSEVGIDTAEKKLSTLIYFDDHQSGYRRLIEAQRAGFVHVMYDDGYPWPGDNYALKQACDKTGYLEVVRQTLKGQSSGSSVKVSREDAPSRIYSYRDDFGKYQVAITSVEKDCMYKDMLERLDIYYEFPPLWLGPFRSQTSKLLKTIQQQPIMSEAEGKQFLKKFKRLTRLEMEGEASKYTFFTYIKIKQTNISPFVDCLAEKEVPIEYKLYKYKKA